MNAHPIPLFQVCLAFRPSNASASRADLRRKPFTNFFVDRAFSNGFVREHLFEVVPTGIMNGLGKAGFANRAGAHIANVNVRVISDNSSRGLMQVVAALGRHLGVNSRHKALFTPALGLGKAILGLPIERLGFNLVARGKRSQVLQSQVDADRIHGKIAQPISHFNADVKIPVTTSVLRERASVFDFALRKRPGFKNSVNLLAITKPAWNNLKILSPKRNPAERLPPAPAKPRAAVQPSAFFIKFGDLLNRARVHREFFARPRHQRRQIEITQPLPPATNRGLLRFIAEVPNNIHGAGLLRQPARILHSVTIRQNHEERLP